MGTTCKNPITSIYIFIVFTAEKQLLKVTNRIFEAQTLLAKQTVVLFDVCLGTFSTNASGGYTEICSNEKRYIQEKKPTSKTKVYKLQHIKIEIASPSAIPCCPSNVAWVLPRPQRGEGTLMASWLCAATTYGSTAGASARKRWKGVLDHDYWRLPAWRTLSVLVKVRQKNFFGGEKRHHASFLKISGHVFDGSDLIEGVHIQMLTANSCKQNSSRSLRLIYLQKILVSLNPWTSLQSWKFLTFEHHYPMLLPVWSIEADLVDFTKVLSAYGKTHRWSATLHGLTALDSSTLSAETLMW